MQVQEALTSSDDEDEEQESVIFRRDALEKCSTGNANPKRLQYNSAAPKYRAVSKRKPQLRGKRKPKPRPQAAKHDGSISEDGPNPFLEAIKNQIYWMELRRHKEHSETSNDNEYDEFDGRRHKL